MAPAVYTPVEGFTGTVVGVHFRDGAGETDDPAALGYFQSAGYRIEDVAAAVPPAGTPMTADELAEAAAREARPDAGTTPDAGQAAPASDPEPPASDGPKRPYPQANKAEWFEFLSKVKPGHGLTIDNTKNEIIAAVDAE